MRLWHFIVFPAVTMAILILFSRVADDTIASSPAVAHSDWYQSTRTMVIALAMSSLMAWLAVHYRRGYEIQLQARNDELEATREFLSSIIEGSAEAIVTLDREARVTSWNRAAENIYGWTAVEMTGSGLERLLPDDDGVQAVTDEIERRVRRGETVEHHDVDRIRKDGHRITVHVTRTPLYDSGNHMFGAMSMEHDVTGMREMENRLREQQSLAAVGQQAASVAHEIKNPLAGIRGACEIISDGYTDDDPKKELSVEVLRQVDRLNRTVQELLIFARPQNLKPAVTDLNWILARVLDLLADDPDNRSMEVVRRFQDHLPSVLVDPQQVEQVFFHLVLTAFQVTGQRGRVEVTTEVSANAVTAIVADDGPGMDADVLDHIFEPFFTTRAKGTGLGLAIVRKIVDGHGGTIEVESEPGHGTRFTVAFPLEA